MDYSFPNFFKRSLGSTLHKFLSFLTQPTLKLQKYCFAIFPLAVLPSLALVSLADFVFFASNIDTAHMRAPELSPNLHTFISAVLIAPFFETLLLAAVLETLVKLTDRTTFVAIVSALLWGALHGAFGLLWFFGTVWSFFVFSCAYLGWRRHSFRHGFFAAALPHALVNLSALVTVTLISVSSSTV